MASLLPQFLAVITDAGERQNNEPGDNHFDNCGPACGSVMMQVLGHPDIEPQVWINQMPGYGPNYRGGTMLADLNSYINGHYPNPPLMEIVSPSDPVAAVDKWTSEGLMSIGLFFSNSLGQLQPYRTAIGHYCLCLGHDSSGVTIWNPDQGVQVISDALFRVSSQGIFDVCRQSLTGSSSSIASSEIRVQEDIDMIFIRNNETGHPLYGSIYGIGLNGYRHIAGAEWSQWAAKGFSYTDLPQAAQVSAVLSGLPDVSSLKGVDLSGVESQLAAIKAEVDKLSGPRTLSGTLS